MHDPKVSTIRSEGLGVFIELFCKEFSKLPISYYSTGHEHGQESGEEKVYLARIWNRCFESVARLSSACSLSVHSKLTKKK